MWHPPRRHFFSLFCRFINETLGRFFHQFNEKGNCFTKQVCGKNWFGDLPRKIATFLGIPAEGFTGHTIRRTSASWMANTGMTREDMKRAGRWKSDAVVEGYIDRSVEMKSKTATAVQMAHPPMLLSQQNSRTVNNSNSSATSVSPIFATGVMFSNCNINIVSNFNKM